MVWGGFLLNNLKYTMKTKLSKSKSNKQHRRLSVGNRESVPRADKVWWLGRTRGSKSEYPNPARAIWVYAANKLLLVFPDSHLWNGDGGIHLGRLPGRDGVYGGTFQATPCVRISSHFPGQVPGCSGADLQWLSQRLSWGSHLPSASPKMHLFLPDGVIRL